jgi:hypothetical protein
MPSNPQYPAYRFPQVLARLPHAAQSKYRRIEALCQDAEALGAAALARQHDLETRLDDLSTRLGRSEDEDDRNELSEELAQLRTDLDTLSSEQDRRSNMLRNHQQTLAQLQAFIPHICDELAAPLRALPSSAPNLRKNETLADALSRVRRSISKTQNELGALALLPPTPQAIKQQLRDQVQAMLTAGTPKVTVDPNNPDKIAIEWADVNIFAPNAAPAGSVGKMLAFLFPDQLLQALSKGVDDITGGISAGERAERRAQLEQRLLGRAMSRAALTLSSG